MNSAAMSSIGLLDRIIQTKKEEIEALADYDYDLRSELTAPSFFQSLRRTAMEPVRVIAECKKASPTMGLIREDYDAGAIAREYASLGASALSVLTDRDFFQGSVEDLIAASGSGLPILRKDFIISPKQIFESKAIGASAILLIVRILDDFQLRDFLQIARSIGLDALVEIHNHSEMERAIRLESSIIGINHRDLDTLAIDLSLTERLAPEIRSAKSGALIVAESGVESRGGRDRVDPFVDAILIGTGLIKNKSIAEAWKKIFD